VDIKKGDTVEILIGPDRGKRGLVLRTQPKADKLVVEGMNLQKKHSRQQTTTGSGRTMKGGTVEFPAAMHISNVMLVCPKCGKATRITRRAGEERRGRYCKSCDSSLDAK
jgi:large subunit ribosomal protein L24